MKALSSKTTKEWLYQQYRRSRLARIINLYLKPYVSKGWHYGKEVVWIVSTGAVLLLLPLAISTAIEGEMQAQQISSQISGQGNPSIQYRPY